jgi:hypothetical protein
MTENEKALASLRRCIAQGYTLNLQNLGIYVDDETKTVILKPNPKYIQDQKDKERTSRNEYENER